MTTSYGHHITREKRTAPAKQKMPSNLYAATQQNQEALECEPRRAGAQPALVDEDDESLPLAGIY